MIDFRDLGSVFWHSFAGLKAQPTVATGYKFVGRAHRIILDIAYIFGAWDAFYSCYLSIIKYISRQRKIFCGFFIVSPTTANILFFTPIESFFS